MNWTESFLQSLERAHGPAYVDAVCRGCSEKLQMERMRTMERVQRIATASQHLRHIAKGELDMVAQFDIPSVDYHGWAVKFADKNGNPDYTCWRDPEFLREYWRDNPELRCAEGKRTNRIVVPGKPAEFVTIPVPKAALQIEAREPHALRTVARPPHELKIVPREAVVAA